MYSSIPPLFVGRDQIPLKVDFAFYISGSINEVPVAHFGRSNRLTPAPTILILMHRVENNITIAIIKSHVNYISFHLSFCSDIISMKDDIHNSPWLCSIYFHPKCFSLFSVFFTFLHSHPHFTSLV